MNATLSVQFAREAVFGTQKESPENTLLKVPEVSSLLRRSRQTIYTAISRGEIPVVRCGRRGLRIRASVVRAMLGQG
jgi:excisionase family DNA binding protein